jgi:uncharacterized membrane protein YphA (DoxX/SURF4 family)
MKGKTMQISIISLQTVLGLLFVLIGSTTVAGAKMQVKEFARYRYPQWFRVVTGALEVLAGTGLIAGLWMPLLAVVASGGLAATMLGAMFTHLRMKDPVLRVLVPTVLLALSLLVLLAHWSTVSILIG